VKNMVDGCRDTAFLFSKRLALSTGLIWCVLLSQLALGLLYFELATHTGRGRRFAPANRPLAAGAINVAASWATSVSPG